MGKRIRKWIEKQTLAIGAMSKKQLINLIEIIAGGLLILVLCLIAPDLLMRWQDSRLDGVMQTSERSFTPRSLGVDTTMDRLYNRLLLASGQWEGNSESNRAEVSYGGNGNEGAYNRLSVGMRDSQEVWHSNDSLMSAGNVIRAVYNLEDFGLIPGAWNCFLTGWRLSDAEGVVYRDSLLNKYQSILWVLHFSQFNAGQKADVFVDDVTGNFVGFRMEYEPEYMQSILDPSAELDILYRKMMSSQAVNSTEAENLFQQIQEALYGKAMSFDAGRMMLSVTAIEEYVSSYQEKNGVDLVEYLMEEDLLEAESVKEEELGILEDGSSQINSRTKTPTTFWSTNSGSRSSKAEQEEDAAPLLALMDELRQLFSSSDGKRETQSLLYPTIQGYLDRLGYTEVREVTDSEELSQVIAVDGMKLDPSGAMVYACTETGSGDRFYFVIVSSSGVFEVYFTSVIT